MYSFQEIQFALRAYLSRLKKLALVTYEDILESKQKHCNVGIPST